MYFVWCLFWCFLFFFGHTPKKTPDKVHERGAKCSKKTGIFEGRTATKKIKNPEELFLTHEEGKSFAFFIFRFFLGCILKFTIHTRTDTFFPGGF